MESLLRKAAYVTATIVFAGGGVCIASYDKNTRGYEGQPFTDYMVERGDNLSRISHRISKRVPEGFKRDPWYIIDVIADSNGVDKRTFLIHEGQSLRIPDPENFRR